MKAFLQSKKLYAGSGCFSGVHSRRKSAIGSIFQSRFGYFFSIKVWLKK